MYNFGLLNSYLTLVQGSFARGCAHDPHSMLINHACKFLPFFLLWSMNKKDKRNCKAQYCQNTTHTDKRKMMRVSKILVHEEGAHA